MPLETNDRVWMGQQGSRECENMQLKQAIRDNTHFVECPLTVCRQMTPDGLSGCCPLVTSNGMYGEQ